MVTTPRTPTSVRPLAALAVLVSSVLGAALIGGPHISAAPSTRPSDATAISDSGNGSGPVIEAADPLSIACPIPSGSEFIDSWGARRSGGRRHQGVDMIAPKGTPIVAVQAGDVQFKRSRLGGKAVWLTTPDGNEFYYAHLSGFEGESRSVRRGEVIGYVGSSGNAKGPHLHFETHFGGVVGDPYDATFAACVQPTIDALHALDAIRRGNQFVPATGDSDAVMIAIRTS